MQPLPEKIKQLEVEIGGTVRGQLLKHSVYEFRYIDSAVENQPAVGLLMPPSTPTYRDGDLFAVMDQHLPEGDLFMRLRALFPKQSLTPMHLLALVGSNGIGRLGYQLPDRPAADRATVMDRKALLSTTYTPEVFDELVRAYLSTGAGIAGMQPKIMVPDRPTIPIPTLIVKAASDAYPGLAANEFMCLTAASKAGMIEAMRDIGYSLESAVADIIDNSITARARAVDVRFGWHDGGAWIGIIDDGEGMSASILREAMRPGTRNPLESRSKDDLGRFGLGLKTASFSQCRRLTVLTRHESIQSAARWDLDYVAKTDRWTLQRPTVEELVQLPCFSDLGPQGTLVMWERIDRLEFEGRDERGHQQLNEQMAVVREHIARVFHRFIGGERGYAKLAMRLNLAEVPAFDPFNEKSTATQVLQEERVVTKTGDVRMQAYVLPHHSKVSQAEYQRLAGTEGYLRNQGFYVYRNRRLIVWGTWFRLAPLEELTKLARVKVDIPNTQDTSWAIDVRKSRARPPAAVRSRMKQIVERIRSSAKRPYTHRGTPVSSGPTAAVWQRRAFNDSVKYEVNSEHPLVADLRADLDHDTRTRLDAVLRMVGEAFPAAIFFSDYATNPRALEPTTCDVGALVNLARLIAAANQGIDIKGLTELLRDIEPFAAWPKELDKVARDALMSRT